MKRKLIMAIGPVIVAVVLLIAVFTLPMFEGKITHETLKNAAVVSQVKVKRSDSIYRAAMKDPQFIPFFGSSELQRYDPFHPDALADKYKRDYTPFLIGHAGTESLDHYLTMQAMGDSLNNKKMVFFVSPQWFVKKGVSKGAFNANFSTLHAIDFINNSGIGETERRYVAKRILHYGSTKADTIITNALENISNGEELTTIQKKYIAAKRTILEKNKDVLGSHIPDNSWDLLNKQEKKLPETYNTQSLDSLAFEIAKKNTTNNDFRIKNSFYTKHVEANVERLNGAQKHFNYLQSPEYADFQVVLQELARQNVDVQFVVTPVNSKWREYTQLSSEMLDEFSTKIDHQITSQGFKVIDLTKKSTEPYYMQDTIHLGWRGWVDLDTKIKPFLEDKKTNTPHYKIDSYFMSKEWQQKK